MAAEAASNVPAQQHATQPSFPEDLPPRKFTQTWMQRNRFSAKTFFTLHYQSFSLRNCHGARELWRRISMWLIMVSRIAQLVLFFVILSDAVVFNTFAIVVVAFLVLIAPMLLMVNAWCLALISDVTGTRRAIGFTVRRNGLDWFLHIMAVIHLIVTATCVFWAFSGIALSGVWLVEGIILFVVALMASKEPMDQYGTGV